MEVPEYASAYPPPGTDELTLTPGAETSGTTYSSGQSLGASAPHVEAVSIRSPAEKSGTSRPVSTAPTESESWTFPGELDVFAPPFPADATTTAPAAFAFRTGSIISVAYSLAPRLICITSARSPTTLSLRAASIPPITRVNVVVRSSPGNTLIAWSVASGATPMAVPLAFPPATVPATWVPRPLRSYGPPPSRTTSPFSSISAQPLTVRSGWSGSTPVSSTATVAPAPRVPYSSHTSGARTMSTPYVAFRFVAAAETAPVVGPAGAPGSPTAAVAAT